LREEVISVSDWIHEGERTILTAPPELRERFREDMREQMREEQGGHEPDEAEVETIAAFAWHIRAKEVTEKADLLMEEGVPDSELKNILQVEPDEWGGGEATE
jgi:hypothetical protein